MARGRKKVLVRLTRLHQHRRVRMRLGEHALIVSTGGGYTAKYGRVWARANKRGNLDFAVQLRQFFDAMAQFESIHYTHKISDPCLCSSTYQAGCRRRGIFHAQAHKKHRNVCAWYTPTLRRTQPHKSHPVAHTDTHKTHTDAHTHARIAVAFMVVGYSKAKQFHVIETELRPPTTTAPQRLAQSRKSAWRCCTPRRIPRPGGYEYRTSFRL